MAFELDLEEKMEFQQVKMKSYKILEGLLMNKG